jgi:diadenylate cyclase
MNTTWQQIERSQLFQGALTAADILLVAYVIYRVLILIKGTRAVSVLSGLLLLLFANLISRWLGLSTFHWLIGRFLTYGLAFSLIVVFQDEIRRGLARLGRNSFFARYERALELDTIDEVVAAAEQMAARKVGALMVIERIADLSDYLETGLPVDARVSRELLLTTFHPGSALHDGAAILQGGRISAARCMLPLTSQPVERELGTRHKAALGLSEEVDAAVVVVSEERGEIGLAVSGRLYRRLDGPALKRFLQRLYAPPGGAGRRYWWRRAAARSEQARPPESVPGLVAPAEALPAESPQGG